MSDWMGRRGFLEVVAAGGISLGAIGSGYFLLGIGQDSGPKTPQCGTEPPADLDAPSIGSAKAGVTVSEYTDFSCPHCRDYVRNVFPEIRRQFIQSGQIQYEHYDFPLPVTKWSRPAASAAREVQRRAGDRAFFEYAVALYQHQGKYSYDLFNDLASTVNVRGEAVEQAARNGRYCKTINESIQRGVKHGVSSTPTIFVNDRKLVAPDAEELTNAIKKA